MPDFQDLIAILEDAEQTARGIASEIDEHLEISDHVWSVCKALRELVQTTVANDDPK